MSKRFEILTLHWWSFTTLKGPFGIRSKNRHYFRLLHKYPPWHFSREAFPLFFLPVSYISYLILTTDNNNSLWKFTIFIILAGVRKVTSSWRRAQDTVELPTLNRPSLPAPLLNFKTTFMKMKTTLYKDCIDLWFILWNKYFKNLKSVFIHIVDIKW